ncbi:hypothetical protein BO78DRAFT_133312 [Aspergillus sclerotiicarbonarius CBS 121057]|uniref:Uncharacterized protein n=1 Tax=Aspergillus sclerotiicarbonarius (strain CBS 121057 / IBT 28362) TaxID=1448318 RepID=A0A319EMA6_ASPSB|nr:hypothetical protein BO78DRAFT_133312 [Aspergillus sclerotiicarbonarius CBS 121057]
MHMTTHAFVGWLLFGLGCKCMQLSVFIICCEKHCLGQMGFDSFYFFFPLLFGWCLWYTSFFFWVGCMFVSAMLRLMDLDRLLC